MITIWVIKMGDFGPGAFSIKRFGSFKSRNRFIEGVKLILTRDNILPGTLYTKEMELDRDFVHKDGIVSPSVPTY